MTATAGRLPRVLLALSLAVAIGTCGPVTGAVAAKPNPLRTLLQLTERTRQKRAQRQAHAGAGTLGTRGRATGSPATLVPPSTTNRPTTRPTTPRSPQTSTVPVAPASPAAPTSTAGAGVPTTTSPAATVGTPLARSTNAGASQGLSAPAIALAAVGALVLLACLGWAVGRFWAIEPRWSLSLRHSLTEAGYRTTSTWSEFVDWVRLGH